MRGDWSEGKIQDKCNQGILISYATNMPREMNRQREVLSYWCHFLLGEDYLFWGGMIEMRLKPVVITDSSVFHIEY